jgi:hypothetical protein
LFAFDESSNENQSFFFHAYHASDEVLTKDGLPKDLLIWESQEAWDAFYISHFANLTPDALAFLRGCLNFFKPTIFQVF